MNKYVDTLILFSELPATNRNIHDGFCKINNPFRMKSRPCNTVDTSCYQCIYGRPLKDSEEIKIREYIDTASGTAKK